MLSFLVQYAGWFSILAAVTSIISMAALFIFFAVGGIFGPINDITSVFQMLFLIPVAVALNQIFQERATTLISLVTILAILAMLSIAILQSMLVLGWVQFEQTLKPILLLGIVIGVWWLVVGFLSLNSASFPSGLTWTGIISGVSFIAIAIGFWIGGQEHPLAAVGFLVGAIAVPVWVIWLGRMILSGKLSIPI